MIKALSQSILNKFNVSYRDEIMNKYFASFVMLTLAGVYMCVYGMRKQGEYQRDVFEIERAKTGLDAELRYAALQGDVAKVKSLISQGVNASKPNQYGFLPLEYAYNNKLLKVIGEGSVTDLDNLLKEHTFNLQVPFSSNDSQLEAAIRSGNGLKVKLLLQAGAKLEGFKVNGITPLRIAANRNPDKYGKNEELDPLDVLIAAGANVESPLWREGSLDSPNALFPALDGGYVPNIQKLIEAGANIYAARGDGMNAINYSLGRESNEYPAVIFTVTPKEMDSLVGSMIALTKRKVIGTKDSGKLVLSKLYDALLQDKVTLAKQYNPQVTAEQIETGKVMLRESFNRMLKKPLVLKSLQHEGDIIEPMDLSE